MLHDRIMKRILLITFLMTFTTSLSFAEKGYLYITSTPDSATVTIDGQQYERYFTPVLCTLAVGNHEISITKKYHETQTFSVTIQPEFVIKQTVTFVSESKMKVQKVESMTVPGKYGQLTFITNPLGATVIADGEELDIATPITLSDIPAGKHYYSIVYQFLEYDTTIEITGDAPQTAMIDFRKFQGEDMYSIMPHVKTKVVIVLPGCDYKQDEKTGALMIKGVDAEIKIRTGDTSLALTHRELAEFTPTSLITLAQTKNEKRLPQTEYTYYFEPFIDAQLKFDVTSFTNKKKLAPKDSARVSTSFHQLPASLNSGEEINVRINIGADGEILVRYW